MIYEMPSLILYYYTYHKKQLNYYIHMHNIKTHINKYMIYIYIVSKPKLSPVEEEFYLDEYDVMMGTLLVTSLF